MGILVIGAVFVDIKGYPTSQYIPGGRNAGRVVTVHGGVARNVAEDLGNVGVSPLLLSLVEDTGIGRDVMGHLEKVGVRTEYMGLKEDGMGTWLAVFENTGDVVASISKRPNLHAIEDILSEKGDEILEKADSLVLEMDMDVSLLEQIFSLAQKHGKKVYGLVSNMSIALERRSFIAKTSCFVCNKQEAELFFSENFVAQEGEALAEELYNKIQMAGVPQMVVTMGGDGSFYACSLTGEKGVVKAPKVDVIDTTGCGDAFCAGLSLGLTYGKSLREACEIGTRLATSVVATTESVCPNFRPEEFGLKGYPGEKA
ncbi:MAG: carbohydrate kinase family protein [Blautia sp.]|nr:carbohydrate kinase family protein [Blautia sp.]